MKRLFFLMGIVTLSLCIGTVMTPSTIQAQHTLVGDTVSGCLYLVASSCDSENLWTPDFDLRPGFVDAVVSDTGSSDLLDAEFQPFDSQFGGDFADFSANQLKASVGSTGGLLLSPAKTWEFTDLDWTDGPRYIVGVLDLGGDLPITNLSFTADGIKFDTPAITPLPGGGEFVLNRTFQFQTRRQLNNQFAPLGPGDVGTAFSRTPCGGASAGTFTITATFTNISTETLSDLVLMVKTLTGGNVLCNADRGPGGAGATLTVPLEGDLADGQLSPGESFVVELPVGLQNFNPFTFVVDVLGEVD